MQREWLLKKNCSMSPRQVGMAYGLLCLFLLVIGLGFALHGAWFVPVFALLDIGVLATALLCYARHEGDRERIALTDDSMLVERVEAGQVRHIRLEACWTRIVMPDRQRSLIALESRGVRVEIGGFVGEELRGQVAQELRRELRKASLLR
ncbi:DUF2244 domain-containing protein [Massilia antarctica]|uniref:DUF2244 domain-containing protein n=1 Tax=Massilia antarctica TaxID=2765360 RepID=A0AA48WB46_9BURK|nr:DUF2244 domain-containing protein [Massilia antarctica]QPI48741.1 DUF2244 domain-containing protein [Massilia antarctica]